MASASTRPVNHAERDACIAAAEPYFSDTKLDPVIRVTMDNVFMAPCEVYLRARVDNGVAVGTAAEASLAATRADTAFDEALLEWSRSVRDPKGRSISSQLSPLLGGLSPWALTRRSHRVEVNRVNYMLVQLQQRPTLHGDPALLDGVRKAVAALAAAVTANELARRKSVTAGNALAQASKKFDRAWGQLVRSAENATGERGKGLIPTFRRGEARVEEAAVPPAACEVPDAPAEDPAQTPPIDPAA